MGLDLLEIQNPWWQSALKIKEDRDLLSIKGKPYRFDPPLKNSLSLQKGDIHIVRGPRQVGKTTLLKLFIERLIDGGKEAKRILYLSCESITDFRELEEILVFWFRRARGETYLFLDEISFVPEWQRALLALANMGFLTQACVLLTGSNAKDLKRSGERLPGRRGQGKDHSLYPLSLSELKGLTGFRGKTDQELLQIYLTLGGFPLALKDYFEYGVVSDSTYETYRNWIIGDAHRYHLRQETLRQILFRVAETMTSRITWPKLIENSPVKSHETALQYVEHLEDAFLCHTLRCYDPDRDGAAPQKARKIYFIDPLLYVIAITWQRGIPNAYHWFGEQLKERSFLGRLFELVTVSHYKRRFDPVYFWYSSKDGKEVDLVLRCPAGIELIDVKWALSPSYRALNRDVSISDPDRFFHDFGSTAPSAPSSPRGTSSD